MPKSQVNKDYLKELFLEQKSLLKLSDVRSIKVPKFDELSVKNLFDRFKEDETIMKYMPNKTADGKLPDRTYFFNVLNQSMTDFDLVMKHRGI